MLETGSHMTTPYAIDVTATGISVAFYPPRLSDDELNAVENCARYCLRTQGRAKMLAAYLDCIVSLERDRRNAEATGHEVIEVSMPVLPCHVWSNPELCAAMTKAAALLCSTNGEVNALLQKLNNALLVEAQYRLDPNNVAGI
jgi:hypothetical protein